jgi:LPXTG-site transpeptidase (sortase) family protein
LSGTAGEPHTNTFTVSAEDAGANSDTASDSASVNFTDVLPDISVTKTPSVASVPETGGSVTFTYTVNNNSTVPVTITDLGDDVFTTLTGSPTCQVGTTLTVGGSCSFTYTTTLSGTAGDTHTNTFTVTAGDVDGNPDTASDSADVTFTDVLPDISVTKTASVVSVPETGGSVTFSYTVNNNSTVPVTINALSDDMFAAVVGNSTCQVGTTLIAGGNCSFTYTTTLSGTAGDTHTNTFTVTAEDVDGNSDTASDSADVTFTDVLPDISVTKTASVASVPETGGSVSFTYTVNNNSTIPVTITDLGDDVFTTLTGSSTCQIGTDLAAGTNCSFTYTTTLSGTAGDTHTNTFTVTAEDVDGNSDTASDSASVNFTDVLPNISVTKTASVVSVPETGGNVTFTYTVTNDGAVPVTITDLGDDVFTTLTGSPTCQVGTTLAASGNCSFTYTTTLSGTAGDTHTNTFTVTAEDVDGNSDTASDSASVNFTDVLPDISVTKTSSVISVPETGGSITFTYTVNNNSTVPVTITALSDDKFPVVVGNSTCQIGTTLAVGSDCSFTYTTTLSGTAGESHTNTFTVTAEDVDGNPDTASDSASVAFTDVLPSISVTKTTSVASVPETGGSVTFTYTVNNDGTIPVTITDLGDDVFTTLTGSPTCQLGTTLIAGGNCSFTYTTTLSGTAGDTHTNTFTVTAEDVDGNSDTASDSASVNFTDVLPNISVTKTASVASVPETGGSVTFTYTVNNNSTIPVTITDLGDDVFTTLTGSLTCQVGTTLTAGGNCSFTYTTTLSGTAGDTHTNTFTVTAEDVDGNSDTASDSATVDFTDVLPDISVTKTASVISVPETGGSVTFTYTVNNNSTVPVTITDLGDDVFTTLTGSPTCQVGTTLTVGGNCSFTYTTTLSGTAGESHTNTFMVTAEDVDGNSDTASDSADVTFTDVLPDISVTKTASVASVPETGGSVTFTYTVNNDGMIPVTITDLGDDMFADVVGDSTCQVGTNLTAGSDCSFTYTTTLSGTAGEPHTNTFTVTAEDVDGNIDTASDSTDVAFIDTGTSVIGVAKDLDSSVLVSSGTYDVTYTLLVRNYGTKDLANIQVVDDLKATFPDPAIIDVQSVSSTDFSVNAGYDGDTDTDLLEGTDSLAAGESGTITLVVRVTPDIVGPYNNSATVSAMTTTGTNIDDLSHDGNDPDGAVAEHDGDPTNNSDPTPISFTGSLFDPPTGIKTVDGSGKPQLLWTMVWINNANHFAVNAVVHDPIPLNSTYTVTAGRTGTGMPAGAPAGSTMDGVSCTAGTSTTTLTTMCYYEGPTMENPRGQVIWTGTVDSDFGITDPTLAENAITISFAVTAADGITRIRNSATIDSDLNGNGTTTDPGEVEVATVAEVWGTSTHTSTSTSNIAIPSMEDFKIPQTGFAPDVVTPLSVQPLDRQYRELGDFWLEIPSLGVKAEIVGVPKAGDSWDVSWLGSQAGWLNGTAFPTWSGNSVITGHVYTSDGKPGPFINLGNLKYGDRIIVHAFGQQYIYEVRETTLITTDDAAEMVKHEDLPWLTLVTCRGYDAETNTYRFRYLVRAVQVNIK